MPCSDRFPHNKTDRKSDGYHRRTYHPACRPYCRHPHSDHAAAVELHRRDLSHYHRIDGAQWHLPLGALVSNCRATQTHDPMPYGHMAKSRSKTSRQSVKKSAPGAKSAKKPAKGIKPAKGKWVYAFGGGKAAGRASMRNLLGGKGAGLAEMAHLGLPVPPGFTITTEVCTYFYEHDKSYPKDLKPQVEAALAVVGRITGKKFGDPANPLLVSVRSGARASMPGMMDTVLNLGLNDVTVKALAEKSGDRRFALDSYRRFITMYSDVVLGLEHSSFEEILDELKDRNGYTLDTDLNADDLEKLVTQYKARVEEETGKPFPQDPHAQLWGAIGAVFGSWMNPRAITYRRLHNIPASWGTAV